NRRFMGLHRIRRQILGSTPRSSEPRRKLSPRIAAFNKWARIEALQRLKSFIEAYREAWNLWVQGVYDVVFPPGTYALKPYVKVASVT
ncbi:MAG: hypothetical protein V1754_10385, partial [Pseudomonadota bacterium]